MRTQFTVALPLKNSVSASRVMSKGKGETYKERLSTSWVISSGERRGCGGATKVYGRGCHTQKRSKARKAVVKADVGMGRNGYIVRRALQKVFTKLRHPSTCCSVMPPFGLVLGCSSLLLLMPFGRQERGMTTDLGASNLFFIFAQSE